MPAHVLPPAGALVLATFLLVASHRYRLPKPWWPVAIGCGLGALLLPSLADHYASSRADLAALVALTVAAFEAVGFASRTRTAQLRPGSLRRLDAELRLLTREQ
ncbi:membrane hypothetical protein [Nostocoides japonicum T1-X7]|uniref:Uncharacterized protein n=1 Tax=Nostocoides japonicum T1-X7 TaxID=1194083 RepID=A0A077LY20_9MICO|nr:membrane hypothetical protein [Tetrasphaera japonica T1-X7]